MKKLYCPTCHQFKSRLQVTKVDKDIETYYLKCKRCNEFVETTENMLIRIETDISKLNEIIL